MKLSEKWVRHDWHPSPHHWCLMLWGDDETLDCIGWVEGDEGHYDWQVQATYSGSTKTLRAAKLAVQRYGLKFLRDGLKALEEVEK